MSADQINQLRELFQSTVKKIKKYLGNKAFSIFQIKTGTWNTTSNRLLYEAEMLAFADVPETAIKVTPAKFKDRLRKLMESDENFRKALDAAGGRKVEERVNSVKSLLLVK